MIDFDEIEDQEQQTFARQRRDEESRQQEEEERRSREEARRFKWELMLEQEAERRCQIGDDEKAENQEGVLGVMLAGSASGPCFTDMINESLLTIGRLFAKHPPQGGAMEYLQRSLAALVAFLNALGHCHIHNAAAVHFEHLQGLFGKPKSGLSALVKEIVPRSEEEDLSVNWGKLAQCLQQVFACLARINRWVATRRKDVVDAIAHGFMHLSGFMAGLIGPVGPPEWPTPDAAEAIEISLSEPEKEEGLTLKVRASLTAEELRRLLVECLGVPPTARLCSPGEGAGKALPPNSKLRTLHRKIVIHGIEATEPAAGPAEAGSGEAEAEAEAEAEEAAGGEASLRRRHCVVEAIDLMCKILWTPWLPADWQLVAGAGWVSRWHILKTTPLTATRLLHQLRTHFQTAEFQEMYRELKMRMRHIQCALDVQQRILPAYGFANTVAGVNDMRAEVTSHECNYGDLTVEKLRREIHGLLEYGEPPRKMPVTRAIEPKRFPLQQKSSWMKHLADEGFAVIANVASQEEVQTAYKLLWDFIERSDESGIVSRKSMTTWFDAPVHDKGWPAERDDGIIHSRGIGQSEVLWYLRSLPALRGIFAEIWGTEDLVTSFDGACVFRPCGQFSNWRTTKKNWFHVDQTHKRRGLHCIQGLLTMKDASRKTGGLVVVPRSHRFFGDILRRYEEPRSQDSLHLDMTDPVLTEGESGPRLVCASAGDLLIWDSRTVHCNTPPLVDDKVLLNSGDLIRAVAYICMTPAEWCSKEVADSRHEATRRGITTTHVPHAYRPMDVPERFPAIQLNPEQKQLVAPLAEKPIVTPKLGYTGAEKLAIAAMGKESAAPSKQGGGQQAPKPGRISFLPARQFQVTGGKAPVRKSATTEWGSVVGAVLPGGVLSGYAFGEWLRLSNWPKDSLPEVELTEDLELWTPMKWPPSGRLEPLDGLPTR